MSSLSVPALGKLDISRRLGFLSRLGSADWLGNVVVPAALGLVLGGVLIYTRQLSSKWAGLVILATLAPTVALVVNDMRKLLLITMIADIITGLDISLAETPGHVGAPSGFIVSLMTMALVVGYGLWVAGRTGDNERVRYHRSITLPAVFYLFAFLLSAAQSVNVRLSITQLFMELQFVLMYFYLINHVKNWRAVRLVFTTLIICLLAESALMLLQQFTGFQFAALGVQSWTTGSRIRSASTRTAGTLGSANAAATVVAALLTLAFAAYLTDGRLANKRLSLVAMLLGVPALVFTQSRSAWFAFAVGMLLLTGHALVKGKGGKAVLLLIVAALVIGVGFQDVILERLTTDDRGSADSRGWYNEMAFNIIKAQPFTGIGLNNLWLVQNDYLPIELMRIDIKYRYIVHNKYLLVWSETGLFGFMAFLLLLLAAAGRALRALMRATDPYVSITMAGLLVALSVYLIHMMSDPFNARSRLQLLWLIIALIAAVSRIAREKKVFT